MFKEKAVFLDRDGVINQAIVRDGKPYPPKSLKSLKIISGVNDSLQSLISNGWKVIVVTNQPDPARGFTSRREVEKINDHIKQVLSITEVFTCYHIDKDRCYCRKPKAGLLIFAAKKYKINLNNSYMIGDRWKDIEAGNRAGCKTFFIDYSYKEKKPVNFTYQVKSFNEAVKIILKN
jgi:D-glycero-D-manno-heptose 1,7-bisphosphate phosphatase